MSKKKKKLKVLKKIEKDLSDISFSLMYQILLNDLQETYRDGLISKNEYLAQSMQIAERLANP